MESLPTKEMQPPTMLMLAMIESYKIATLKINGSLSPTVVVVRPVSAELYPASTQSQFSGAQPSTQRYKLEQILGTQQVCTPPHSNVRSKAQQEVSKRTAPVHNSPTYNHPTSMRYPIHYAYTQSQHTRPNEAPCHTPSHLTPSHYELPPHPTTQKPRHIKSNRTITTSMY